MAYCTVFAFCGTLLFKMHYDSKPNLRLNLSSLYVYTLRENFDFICNSLTTYGLWLIKTLPLLVPKVTMIYVLPIGRRSHGNMKL